MDFINSFSRFQERERVNAPFLGAIEEYHNLMGGSHNPIPRVTPGHVHTYMDAYLKAIRLGREGNMGEGIELMRDIHSKYTRGGGAL